MLAKIFALWNSYFPIILLLLSLSLSQEKLTLYNIKEAKPICDYNYFNSILAVKLNRERLIVCLEDRLLIHAMRTMDSLHTIHDIPPNPNGLCALSINNENCCLAYPGSNQNGTVQIFNAITLKTGVSIAAHKSPIAALAFNKQGSIIATASEKGTVIRVFSIPDGDTLFEFRRGLKRYVHINSLSFSADSIYLCASSNTETVHIFRMETQTDSKPQESWFEYYLNSAIKQSAAYLPSQVSDLFNKDRAFAVCRLPNNGFKNACAIATIQKVRCVLVASQDGWVYIYNLNPNDSGECMLIKQHSLAGQPCDGGPVSVPPSSIIHRQLIQTSGPINYAGSLTRVEPSSNECTPPHHQTESQKLQESQESTGPNMVSGVGFNAL